MISLHDIAYAYEPGRNVLDGLSFDVAPGLTLLLGPNGSGKSTLLRILAGVERPDRGRVEIGGHDLWQDEVAARQHLAYVPEQPDVTPYAAVRDVIELVCRLRAQPLSTVAAVLSRAGLTSVAHRSVRELSMGQRRRAMLAAAWIGAPRVVILDEPLEAMDRAIYREIIAWVAELVTSGACVIISTHEIEPFVEMAARAIAIREGQCRFIEPLPGSREERMVVLDAACRGV